MDLFLLAKLILASRRVFMLKTIFKASRPATLVVAVLSTFLGIIAAYRQGYIFDHITWDILRILLVILAAVLLQSGMNMMNNYFEEDVSEEIKKDRKYRFLGYKRTYEEILTFKTGIICFIITTSIGVYLSLYSGIEFLIIGLIGIFAAYAYAGEPFCYKKYGLGVLMSFLMMGPLMAYGSFYVFSKSFSIEPILYSFTSGLFIPAILLANEIRDYEEDKRKFVGTLTVRIGYKNGKLLYYSLIALAYINIILLTAIKYISISALAVLVTLPLIKGILYNVNANKKKLIPLTARLYLSFSFILFLILILTK